MKGTLDLDVIESLRQLGDDDLVKELVGLFVADTPGRLDKIAAACGKRDAGAIESAAHALKSSSANLGALLLSELCRELETAGKQGSIDKASELIVLTREEYDRVTLALESCLGR